MIGGCSAGSGSIYSGGYPLTNETVKSKSSQLTVKIPQGWFSAEENENNIIEIWLIREDYSATLNFIPLNIDSAAVNEIGGDEINGLMSLSRSFIKMKYGKSPLKFMNQEIFLLNGKKIGAYEYTNDSGAVIRTAVFKLGNKFYEFSAVPIKSGNQQELFKVQNSVLSSIE